MSEILVADVDAIRAVQIPPPVWPTVEALRNPNAVEFGDPDPLLPEFTPGTAGLQSAEKSELPASPISVRYVSAAMRTVGNTIDLSLQARRDAGSPEPIVAILTAATAEEANRLVLQSLQAAAAVSDTIAAAIGAVAGFGGPILVITSDLAAAGDLLAMAALSMGRVEVLYDPSAGSTITLARVGVALEVRGVASLEGERPALLGHDLATYATIIGPVVSPGAVAVTGLGPTPEPPTAPVLLTAEAGDAEVELTWLPPSSDGGLPLTAYLIERDTPGTGWSLLAEVGAGVTTYTDTTVSNGVTYGYRVSAANAAGTGPASNVLEATPSGGAPAGRTIGNDVDPTTFDTTEAYTTDLAIMCGHFTTDEWGGELAAGHIYVHAGPNAGDTQAMRLLIYADDGTGNNPSTTLIGVTDELVMSTPTGGWRDFPGWTAFGGPPTLAPGTKYWLGAWWGTKTGPGGSQITVRATDDAPALIHGAGSITYSASSDPVVSSWGAGSAMRQYIVYFDYA